MEEETKAKILRIAVIILVFFLVNLIGAAILLPLEPDLSFLDTFYLMMSTSTTVGYGNIAPETGGGKMFMSFFQVVPIGLFFYALSLFF